MRASRSRERSLFWGVEYDKITWWWAFNPNYYNNNLLYNMTRKKKIAAFNIYNYSVHSYCKYDHQAIRPFTNSTTAVSLFDHQLLKLILKLITNWHIHCSDIVCKQDKTIFSIWIYHMISSLAAIFTVKPY